MPHTVLSSNERGTSDIYPDTTLLCNTTKRQAVTTNLAKNVVSSKLFPTTNNSAGAQLKSNDDMSNMKQPPRQSGYVGEKQPRNTSMTILDGSTATLDSFKNDLQFSQRYYQKHPTKHHDDGGADCGAAGAGTKPLSGLFADRVANEFAAFMFDGRNEISSSSASSHLQSHTEEPVVWQGILREHISVNGCTTQPPSSHHAILSCQIMFPSQFPFVPPFVDLFHLTFFSPWSGESLATYSPTSCVLRSLQSRVHTRLTPLVWTPASPTVHKILTGSLSHIMLHWPHPSTAIDGRDSARKHPSVPIPAPAQHIVKPFMVEENERVEEEEAAYPHKGRGYPSGGFCIG